MARNAGFPAGRYPPGSNVFNFDPRRTSYITVVHRVSVFDKTERLGEVRQ